jgi:hypothetical protein
LYKVVRYSSQDHLLGTVIKLRSGRSKNSVPFTAGQARSTRSWRALCCPRCSGMFSAEAFETKTSLFNPFRDKDRFEKITSRLFVEIRFTLHYITLHHITLHYVTSHYITLRYITLHYITLHYITLHYITLHYITSHHITLQHITSHHITLCYITLSYITLRYITLCHITLRYKFLLYVLKISIH